MVHGSVFPSRVCFSNRFARGHRPGLLSPLLPLRPSRFQFTVPSGEDRVFLAPQHRPGGHVPQGRVQPDLVGMLDLVRHDPPRIG